MNILLDLTLCELKKFGFNHKLALSPPKGLVMISHLLNTDPQHSSALEELNAIPDLTVQTQRD